MNQDNTRAAAGGRRSRVHHPVVWGTILGLVSAVSYTAANIFLRAAAELDPIWVSCIKAFPTVIGVAPWLVLGVLRAERVFPATRVMIVLVFTGLFGQLGGNVLFQCSLGMIGIALTVPLCLGGIIISSAFLGRILLRESVTALTVFSMAILVAAIWCLSTGAEDAYRAVSQSTPDPWVIAAGVASACTSGFAYAVLGAAIRYAVTRQASVVATTFTIAAVGLFTLGMVSLWRMGPAGIAATESSDWLVMLLAGVCNLAAFVALTRALQLTTLIYVNALNATQVAMAALAGVALFHETPSPGLATGVGLTIAGLLFMPRHGSPARQDADRQDALPPEDHRRPNEETYDRGVQKPRNRCSSSASRPSSQAESGPTEPPASGPTISDTAVETHCADEP